MSDLEPSEQDKPSKREQFEEDRSDTDEDLASLLISWDEALAAGELPTWRAAPVASEGKPRLKKTIACVDLLRRLWPRHGDSSLNPDVVFLEKAAPAVQRIGQFEIR